MWVSLVYVLICVSHTAAGALSLSGVQRQLAESLQPGAGAHQEPGDQPDGAEAGSPQSGGTNPVRGASQKDRLLISSIKFG